MADPLTAIGAAAACLQLATAAATVARNIVKFYLDTKKVNESVNHLAAEVKSLGGACDLIQVEMVTVARGPWSAAYDEDGRLSNVVIEQLEMCRTTVRKLEEVVTKVNRERPHWLDKPHRQLQLLWNKDNIEDFRRRISTHTQALQIVLQVVNIKISHVAPGHANHDLSEKLDKMHVDLKQVIEAKKSDDTVAQFISVDLVQCAEDTFTSGTTLYQGSVTGSVQGGKGAANRNLMVVEWASNMASLRLGSNPSDSSDMRSRSGTTFTVDDSMTEVTDQTPAANPRIRGDDEEEVDINEDSADEDAIEMAQAAIKEGTLAFDREAWADAASLFQESLIDLNRLPVKRRSICDLFELNYKLVVCSYHRDKTPQVIEALVDFLSQQASSDADRRRICDAGHMLSQLYVRDGSLDLALTACENALKARRRLLGSEDETYYESLALMAKIHELKGNRTRSIIYAGRIPASHKTSLLGVAQGSDSIAATDLTSADNTTRDDTAAKCVDKDLRREVHDHILERVPTRRFTGLELAIMDQQFEVALLIIKTAEQLNIPDALILAVCFGDLDVVIALLKRAAAKSEPFFTGPNDLRQNYFQQSPLELAFSCRWPAIVRLLAKHEGPGNKWRLETLFYAIPQWLYPCKDAQEYIAMLDMVPVDPPRDLCNVTIKLSKQTGIEDEVTLPVLEYLLRRQPNILSKIRLRASGSGNIPLHHALAAPQCQTIAKLLEEQASEQLQHRDDSGQDALLIALEHAVKECSPETASDPFEGVAPERLDAIGKLLQAGAQVETRVKLKADGLKRHWKAIVHVPTIRRPQTEVVVTAKQIVKAIDDAELTALFKKY